MAGQYVAAARRQDKIVPAVRAGAPAAAGLPARARDRAGGEMAAPQAAGEVLLARFAAYLGGERGLAAATVSSYLLKVRPFVAAHADACRWPSLSARQVARFAADPLGSPPSSGPPPPPPRWSA